MHKHVFLANCAKNALSICSRFHRGRCAHHSSWGNWISDNYYVVPRRYADTQWTAVINLNCENWEFSSYCRWPRSNCECECVLIELRNSFRWRCIRAVRANVVWWPRLRPLRNAMLCLTHSPIRTYYIELRSAMKKHLNSTMKPCFLLEIKSIS